MRTRAARPALIEKNDPKDLGIEEPTMIWLTPGAGPAVEKHHRQTVRIAALLDIKLVGGLGLEVESFVRFDFRVQGEHYSNSSSGGSPSNIR